MFIFKIGVKAYFQAEFLGCDRVVCENSDVMTCKENNISKEFIKSDTSLPNCLDDGFNGWILKFRSNYVYDYATYCDDKDSVNSIKKYKDCEKPHVFKNNFNYSINKAKDASYTIFYFEAVINNNIPSEYDNTPSRGDIIENDQGNYSEDSIVSCGPDLIKDIPSLIPSTIHIIYLILQMVVPVILVVLGVIDFVKALTSQKDDEIKKGQKTFISRLIAGVLVFFIFSIVKLVISLVADNDKSAKIINCVDCFISDNDKCIR